ncbi:MAG: hypothetical protein SH820_16560 [Xanthomonadales bacterium]|nr:hypothetical protein [Xanthomonadales bacterium]
MSAENHLPKTPMRLPMRLTVGVTGHRDLVAAEVPEIEARVRQFLLTLDQRFPDLMLQLLTPLAEGGDQLVARVALGLDIELVAVLPFDQAEYEKDFETAAKLDRFRGLLQLANQVIELPLVHGEWDDGVFSAAERDRQYAQAGVFISNHCQILLALWDGKPPAAVGGTADVVRYHLTTVMQGFEDQQTSAQLLADNENDLAYHIACSRDRPEGQCVTGLQPLDCAWITSESGVASTEKMPASYASMLDSLQQFERDRRRYLGDQHRPGTMLDEGLPGRSPSESVRFVEYLFDVADHLAMHYQAQVNRNLLGIYGLATLMGLVFILYSEYSEPHWLIWLFLGLFGAGVALHITANRRQWHRKYLDYRALAEALRVQFYWHLSGVVESRSVAFAYENFLQKQDVELGWIRHVMRAASLRRSRGREPDPAWVPWVIQRWVGDASAGDGQLAYYSRKAAHNSKNFRRTQLLGSICLWSGIAIAVVLGLLQQQLTQSQQQSLMVLIGILPLLAGIRDTISHKRAEKELIKQYRFMARIFANARELLDQDQDLAFQRRVLKALGEAALEEGAEWILMHRARPLEHGGLG